MLTKQDLVRNEKYLKLNEDGAFVIDNADDLEIIDFHTHMCNALPLKYIDPNSKGNKLTYPTLPAVEKIDFSVPYWTKEETKINRKGLLPIIRYGLNAYDVLQDMMKGGTYDNCFKSQGDNQIGINVILPLSTKKCDCSPEALKIVADHPNRFVAFCSVHPDDSEMKEKIVRYKALGAKGFKLKISELELKNDFTSLITLFKTCYEAELPVILHTGAIPVDQERTSKLLYKYLKSTRVELFGRLLAELPKDFVFIFGHSGISEYKLVAEYLKKYPASYAEVSSQSQQSISYLIAEVGSQRLLFGSDWPALPQAITLSRVLLATEDNKTARAQILSKNAKTLLGL
ncbi:amidohydrolase family protein [Acetobacterium woodii]|uniref:Putative amidohydrolase 2 n=1 Tax=Acetobacterium woodii (strain ATCC 29683 / DSM 1030 / JCM 2381 / KCTC 1655 / WB1) TaxID=931626 RepID=H6LFM8_ACEWD|nr:amidohydrolase family protein [Acetobacterium woodii]AFA46973.1 putative amidohydrolase 2 [Acetobacterium woodii DSM 1030]